MSGDLGEQAASTSDHGRHDVFDSMTISTPDVAEEKDVAEVAPSPIHFRREASTEANSLCRGKDIPTNPIATRDVNRSERSSRKDDRPTTSFTTHDVKRRKRHQRARIIFRRETSSRSNCSDRKNDQPTKAFVSPSRPRTNRQPGFVPRTPAVTGHERKTLISVAA